MAGRKARRGGTVSYDQTKVVRGRSHGTSSSTRSRKKYGSY